VRLSSHAPSSALTSLRLYGFLSSREERGPRLEHVQEHARGNLAVARADAPLLEPQQRLAGVQRVERLERGWDAAGVEERQEAALIDQVETERLRRAPLGVEH
jgi:hypothetical protein